MRERSTQLKPSLPRLPSSLAMAPEEFRKAGTVLVNKMADFLSVLSLGKLPNQFIRPEGSNYHCGAEREVDGY